MQNFGYARATSVDDAVAAADPALAFLAGGTELLNWLRLGIASPARILDITRIPSLDLIATLPGGGLRIGALNTLNAVAGHAAVVRDYPVLAEAIAKAASAQLRNLATIGGNLLQKTRCPYFRAEEATPCNKRVPGSGCAAYHGINDKHAIFGWSEQCVATQPSDPAVALAALDAIVVVRGARGERRVAARAFHRLPGDDPTRETELQPGELITAIELPAPAPHSAYLKIRERESYEYATVSAAVTLTFDRKAIAQARIALGSVALRPWRLDEAEHALVGLDPASDATRAAIAAAFAAARPLAHNAHKVPLACNAVVRLVRDIGRRA